MPRGVKKVEEVKEEVVEVVEEIKEEVAAAEDKKEEKKSARKEEKKVDEEVVVNEAPAVKQKVDEVPNTEVPKVEEKITQPNETETAESNEWKFVQSLRIYPKPGNLSCYTIFTGNVKVVADLGELKRIQYMKHGFGLVEALTDML